MTRVPLKVAVLVDLERTPIAGGHVKCWERLAEAAVSMPDSLDLTVYFLGQKIEQINFGPNVRFRLLTPILGTRQFIFLRRTADHTDLAWFHGILAQELWQYDVIHTTDTFAFAQTAIRHRKKNKTVLVASLHTDLIRFTRIYSEKILLDIFGKGRLGRFFIQTLSIPDYVTRRAERRLTSFLNHCDYILASSREDTLRLQKIFPPSRFGYLRRGIDKERFHPKHRDRVWLNSVYGIPPGVPVLLFVGRVDESKGVMILAEAAKNLIDSGISVHVMICGKGDRADTIKALLESNVTLTGSLAQEDLARIYATCDLFIFPSASDLAPNVVIEAKTSGLVPIVAAGDGGAQFVRDNIDGVVENSREAIVWAGRIRSIIENDKI
ncbi:MAG: glycosyltransferase [Alphaproteobacteria bacterium]